MWNVLFATKASANIVHDVVALLCKFTEHGYDHIDVSHASLSVLRCLRVVIPFKVYRGASIGIVPYRESVVVVVV